MRFRFGFRRLGVLLDRGLSEEVVDWFPRGKDAAGEGPDEEDAAEGEPEDARVDHAAVVGTVDGVEVRARARVVGARHGAVRVAPVRLERGRLGHVLDVSVCEGHGG